METIVLTEENVFDYEEYLTPDVAENIGRQYYRGIVVTDADDPVAGIVWKFRNNMKEGERESHIEWLQASGEEAGEVLFGKYNEMIAEENVFKSTFCLPAREGKEKKALLTANGFSVKLTEGDVVLAKLSEIGEISFLKNAAPSEEVMPLRLITQRGFNIATRRMVNSGFFGLCEDISLLPRMFFENDISCYFDNDGVVNGLFLCHRTTSGRLVVELMAAIGAEHLKILVSLISAAYRKASEIYPPETEVLIDRHNYASQALVEKLFPESFGIPIYVGERQE